jgi:serine/threonine protein kinase
MLYELLVGAHPFMRDGATEQQVMAAIRAAKLSFPASLDKALANIVARALTPDLKGRYRTAGELAGPLFGYALDQNLLATPARVQEWLEGQLGLLV